ncbi:MAG: aminopeptidase, partial [Spirochaetota bacterium]
KRNSFRRVVRRVLLVAFVIVPVVLLDGSYVAEQGVGFFSDLLRAQPNHIAAQRWPEYVDFLAEAAAIRRFGVEELGLSETRSYTRFINTPKDHVAFVVSAARPLSFERKLWRYPLVGTVPYKGFYSEQSALREAARLEAQGWEPLVRKVGAFSSLGYAADPLYSYMSSYHPERIASLLLHEMTHATIWVRGDAALNEAIATYVGDRGALAYLEHRYGMASTIVAEAHRRQADRGRFTEFLQGVASRLEGVYARDNSDAWKRAQREAILAEEKRRFELGYTHWFGSDGYRGLLDRPLTNAYLDLFRVYNADVELVADYHDTLNADLSDLVVTLKGLAETTNLRFAL